MRGTSNEWLEWERKDKKNVPLAGEIVIEIDNNITNLMPTLEEKTQNGTTLSYNNDGTFNITTEDGKHTNLQYESLFTLPAGTYKFKTENVAGMLACLRDDNLVSYDSGVTFTLLEDTVMSVIFYSAGKNCSALLTN